ncbi:MAG TPA: PLP-dependent transferase [Baekduia sp.]|uniref:PLP-dependent transferase n=1 Tax=Baekduia sp. TaxID=2600305 RepID=UPI002CA25D3B|nr:PLP-dependent transferase [Baekduia sp.]HMJ37287.1 PLP-dependent transferase [Baekduia sp.]
MSGDSTRVTHAGLPHAAQGEPFLPGPTFAAPTHWSGEGGPGGYGRYDNPTWTRYEAALGELEGGEAVVLSSGMAAVAAVLLPVLHPGDVLVAPSDAYPGVRTIATDHLRTRGVEVRLVPSTDAAFREAAVGATLVWVETPTNPGMDLLDVAGLARAVHGGGGLLAVDGTLATPLRQRALDLGADFAMSSASKHLTGHSDLVMGYVATRNAARAAAIRTHRGLMGAIPGPFEVWLAHRSLPTLAVRLERQEANAAVLQQALEAHPAATDVRWPGFGSVLAFTLADAEAAERFLGAARLVADATSFGGVHSSAERRGRWGTDDLPEGFIRFSAGIEDAGDLVADVRAALDAAG